MKGADNEDRICIGDYRVRYEIDDKELIILLLQCKHRKDVYRKGQFLSHLDTPPLSAAQQPPCSGRAQILSAEFGVVCRR